MGRYHGRESFLAFSHQRSVLTHTHAGRHRFPMIPPGLSYFDVIRRMCVGLFERQFSMNSMMRKAATEYRDLPGFRMCIHIV